MTRVVIITLYDTRNYQLPASVHDDLIMKHDNWLYEKIQTC